MYDDHDDEHVVDLELVQFRGAQQLGSLHSRWQCALCSVSPSPLGASHISLLAANLCKMIKTESLVDSGVVDSRSVSSVVASALPTQMIVVSNRLPFVLLRDDQGSLYRKASEGSEIQSHNVVHFDSAGGLVTAVAPVVIDCRGLWVGWTGLHDFDDQKDEIPESAPGDTAPTAGLLSSQAVAVTVDPKAFDHFYNGCCNATFWPLFHSMPDRAVFNRDHWRAYQAVNEVFAMKTMEAVRRLHSERLRLPLESRPFPPIVWIHDYHLMLAANTIRDCCSDENIEIRMGFFLHIPFPAFDIVRIFPWVDEILMGMLGCDLVGFHIDDYCVNFLDACQRLLGCRTNKSQMLIEHCGRLIHVKALPIGIPYDKFEELAKCAPRVLPSDLSLVLGVDRLDYTKGLVARMRAVERLFKKYPQWIGRVTFVQVAVPSRTDVTEYRELKENLDRLVGSINGAYSTPIWAPIRYIYGSVNQDQLAAFYRDAQVALITPLRDGMNLVAKEFVACQNEEDPGVLVLSPFAGAGGLMHEALQVNPYETDNVADVLDRALAMSLDERKLRMNQLKKRERKMDVDAWVKEFLLAMDGLVQFDHRTAGRSEGSNGHHELLACKENDDDFERTLGPFVDTCSKLGVILDFDGTLSYLARTPELAIIPPETRKVLERLANMADVHIAIISGRYLDDLRRKVGVDGLTYAGNHGLEILHPDGQKYSHSIPQGYKDRLRLLEQDLKTHVEVDGAWVEHKDLLVAWHYREVNKDRKESLMAHAKAIYAKHEFQHLTVSKRLENLPPLGFNRGDSCIHILRSIFGVDWEERVQVIYAGDSAADEFAMSRLKGVAYSFRVTNEDTATIVKTNADFFLPGPGGVLSLLKFLEKRLLGRTPKTISRASSVISVGAIDREIVEMTIDETSGSLEEDGCGGFRKRTRSTGSGSHRFGFRNRTASQGSQGSGNESLVKKTLNRQFHSRISRDESTRLGSPDGS